MRIGVTDTVLAGLLWCGSLALVQGIPASPARANEIQVTGTAVLFGDVLSDLIVYNADKTQQKIILRPGDASDDVTLISTSSFIGSAPFDIAFALVSKKPPGGGDTPDTKTFTPKLLAPVKVDYFQVSNSGQFLATELAAGTSVDPSLVGTAFSFFNGVNSTLPGVTLGAGFDPNGELTNPYTGLAVFESQPFVVSTSTPEPPALIVMIVGLVGLLLVGKRAVAT